MGDTAARRITITTVEDLERQQHESSLRFVIGRHTPFAALASELIGSSSGYDSVQHVSIQQLPRDVNWLTLESLAFFAALGNLTSLTSIHVRGLRQQRRPGVTGFPPSLFYPLLKPQVKELVVKQCRFEIADILTAIPFAFRLGRANLQRLHWEECLDAPHSSFIGHPVCIAAICCLLKGSLRDLDLAAVRPQSLNSSWFSIGTLNNALVGELVSAGFCHTLRLDTFRLDQEALDSLGDALTKTTCQIKRLCVDLSCSDASNVNNFFDVLRATTKVEKLLLGISPSPEWKEMGCLSRLAACLGQNSSLTAVKLYFGQRAPARLPEDDAVPFIKMLEESNFRINYLELADYNNPNAAKLADQGKLGPVVTYFARSNHFGRRKAILDLQWASAKDWLTHLLAMDSPVSLLNADSHLEVVHYWIRQNPGLFVKTLLSKVIQ